MKQYQKIQTIFLRDLKTNNRTLLHGQWAKPEFEYLQNNLWYCTEKIDGTNMRILWDGKNVEFRGKSDNAQLSKYLVPFLKKTFTIEKMTKVFGTENNNICLYGEGYGKSIQKGGDYMSNKTEFILFDINIDGWWLLPKKLKQLCLDLNIKYVPELGHFTLKQIVDEVTKGYISKISENKQYIAEGIIAKPLIEMTNRKGERIITKLKYKDFKR